MRKMPLLFTLLLFLPACGKVNDELATSIRSAWLTSNAPTLSSTLPANSELLASDTPLPPTETPIAETPGPTLTLPPPIDIKAAAIEYADLGTKSGLYSSNPLVITQGNCADGSTKCLQVFKEFTAINGIGDLYVFLVRNTQTLVMKTTSQDYLTRFGTIPNPSSMDLPADIAMFNDGSNLIVVFSQSRVMVQMVLALDPTKISDSVYLNGESDFLFQLAQLQWQKIVAKSATP